MAVIMVSLHVQDGVTLTRPAGGPEPAMERVSTPELRAHLILTPDGDPALEQVGFVHLRIEAQPRTPQAMTPRDTVLWLRRNLARMLAVGDPPAP